MKEISNSRSDSLVGGEGPWEEEEVLGQGFRTPRVLLICQGGQSAKKLFCSTSSYAAFWLRRFSKGHKDRRALKDAWVINAAVHSFGSIQLSYYFVWTKRMILDSRWRGRMISLPMTLCIWHILFWWQLDTAVFKIKLQVSRLLIICSHTKEFGDQKTELLFCFKTSWPLSGKFILRTNELCPTCWSPSS